jgi:hypothetical protein
MEGSERSPLPGRGLRRPPTRTDRRKRHGRLAPRRIAPTGAEVQVYAAALPLDLVDLAFAVFLAAGLEGEHFQVLGEPLQGGQQARTVMHSG